MYIACRQDIGELNILYKGYDIRNELFLNVRLTAFKSRQYKFKRNYTKNHAETTHKKLRAPLSNFNQPRIFRMLKNFTTSMNYDHECQINFNQLLINISLP